MLDTGIKILKDFNFTAKVNEVLFEPIANEIKEINHYLEKAGIEYSFKQSRPGFVEFRYGGHQYSLSLFQDIGGITVSSRAYGEADTTTRFDNNSAEVISMVSEWMCKLLYRYLDSEKFVKLATELGTDLIKEDPEQYRALMPK